MSYELGTSNVPKSTAPSASILLKRNSPSRAGCPPGVSISSSPQANVNRANGSIKSVVFKNCIVINRSLFWASYN